MTWLWRCACGWSGAMTESGVTNRNAVLAAVRRMATAEPEVAPEDDVPEG